MVWNRGAVMKRILCFIPAIFCLGLFIIAFFIMPIDHPFQNSEIFLYTGPFPEILGILSGLLLYKGINFKEA